MYLHILHMYLFQIFQISAYLKQKCDYDARSINKYILLNQT